MSKRREEDFGLVEVRCEDCDRGFYLPLTSCSFSVFGFHEGGTGTLYILSDMAFFCPYCGSRNTRICADARVEARYVSRGDGK